MTHLGDRGKNRAWLTVAALLFAALAAVLPQSVVIPLFGSVERQLHASLTEATWTLTAPLLAGAVATPVVSRIGDMFGKRGAMVTVMAALTVGSVVSAVATSFGVFVVGRALAGVGVAIVPLTIGVVRDVLPRERVSTGISLLSATLGVGLGLGVIMSGLFSQAWASVHPVFWAGAGIALAATVLVVAAVHDHVAPTGGTIDALGATLLAGMLVTLLIALSEGNSWGWRSGTVLGLFGAAVVLCALWITTEVRTADPLVDVRMLADLRSVGANVGALLLGLEIFAGFTLISDFTRTPAAVGYGFGASVLQVGVFMLPMTGAMVVVSPMAGRLMARLGAATLVSVGALIVGGGYVWLAIASSRSYDFYGASALFGVGLGAAYAALGTMAVEHVPMTKTVVASGVNSLLRTVGGSVSGAIVVLIVSSHLIPHTGVPSLHGYVICFTAGAAGAGVAAIAAAAFGLANARSARIMPVRPMPVRGDGVPSDARDAPSNSRPSHR
jgi:MFS family permease